MRAGDEPARVSKNKKNRKFESEMCVLKSIFDTDLKKKVFTLFFRHIAFARYFHFLFVFNFDL